MYNLIVVVNGALKKRNKVMLKIKGDDTPAITEIDGFVDSMKMREAADKKPDSAASIKKALSGYFPTHKGKDYTVYHKRKGK